MKAFLFFRKIFTLPLFYTPRLLGLFIRDLFARDTPHTNTPLYAPVAWDTGTRLATETDKANGLPPPIPFHLCTRYAPMQVLGRDLMRLYCIFIRCYTWLYSILYIVLTAVNTPKRLQALEFQWLQGFS